MYWSDLFDSTFGHKNLKGGGPNKTASTNLGISAQIEILDEAAKEILAQISKISN